MSVLLEVVSNYADLVQSGEEYKACCPFPDHNDKTPSFTVNPVKGFYHCFGCSRGGDVFEFVKTAEGCSFPEAIEKVKELTDMTEEELMEVKESNTAVTKKGAPPLLTKEQLKEFREGKTYKCGNYRGIKEEYHKFFGHLSEVDSNGNVIAQYYPETYKGKLTGYKSRHHPKKFGIGNFGTTGGANDLSGQARFRNATGKYVLCVGGELDKLAAYQMLAEYQSRKGYSPIPVVSPTTGEGSAAKQCAAQYDWFDRFDNIIIGMDNDEAGIKAAKAVAEVLPKHKVRIATWSKKDPNQMLQEGDERQFISDFYNAREYIESGVKTATDALAGVKDFLLAKKITLPPQLHRLQEAMRGGVRSTGNIINIVGDTSIGKSFFSDVLFHYWIFNSPIIPTLVSLERTAAEVAIDILSLHLRVNLTWFTDGHDAMDYLNDPEVIPLYKELFEDEYGRQRFYIIDEREGDIENLKKQMEMTSKKYESNLFIIDPLTDFLRALGTDEQENFMMWEKMQKKNGMILLNILHTRKPPMDKEGKTRKVTEYDALGSGSFVQSADVTIVLNRDKMAEDEIERNLTYLDLPKCRGGKTGHIGALYYDHKTRQQYDYLDWQEKNNPVPETPSGEF